MAGPREFPTERIEFDDADTGAHVIQLTSYPVNSVNLYYEETPFTSDSGAVIFRSQRSLTRNAPWDLFRVDADGSELVRITDRDNVGDAVFSRDGRWIYYTARRSVRRVDLDGRHDEEIARFDDARAVNQITVCGDHLVVQIRDSLTEARIAVFPNGGSRYEVIHSGVRFGHVTGSPTGNWISWFDVEPTGQAMHSVWNVMRPGGSDHRAWPGLPWCHSAWAGLSDRMQGTLAPPGSGIISVSPENGSVETIAKGPYFWHSSTSDDAEWIVADTNWPNEGLHLIHTPSGRCAPLCRDESSCGHPERTHPHPVMSRDGTKVLFNSDRTGINHVYLVEVPDALRERLRNG